MATKKILGGRFRLKGLATQEHIGFFGGVAPFLAVAGGAGGHQIVPTVGAALMAGDNMINGEDVGFAAAILADVIVAAQDLFFGEGDVVAGAAHHLDKTNDGGKIVLGGAGGDFAASVDHNLGFLGQNER